MMKKRYLVALGAVSAALTACGSSINDVPQPPANTAGSAGSGTPTAGTSAGGKGSGGSAGTGVTAGSSQGGSSGTGGSDGGTGATDPGTDTEIPCMPGIPASSQIPRLLNRQYDAVMRDLLGVTALAGAQGAAPSSILYPDYDGPMNVDSWRLYQEAAAMIASEVMAGANRSKFISCDPATAGCLTQTIQSFGRKAFRRPLEAAEVQRFEKLAQTTPAGTPEEVAQTTLEAFLVSPSFLQKTELVTDMMEAGAIKLSHYEVAARLSFLLWGSIPDDVLDTAANNSQLGTKAEILAQATRMIADRAKTAPLVAAFHRIYLDMENADAHWFKSPHDTTLYPDYAQNEEQFYLAELDKFFEEVAFGGGQFKDIFLSNVGYVNDATAAIYGLTPGSYGTELQRVELDVNQRPGFLTRVGFLQSYSHFDATSPILRGAYITVNILGVNPGAPDPAFFLTPPPAGTYYTERAYVEALTSAPTCTGCHTPYVNPPGFVMENYDAIGKWQTVDPRSAKVGGTPEQGAINTMVTVTTGSANGVDTTVDITSPRQLMEQIANLPKAKRIYATKWVSFATGRLANPQDACTVDVLDMNLAGADYTVLDLLGDLTQSDAFRLRVRGN